MMESATKWYLVVGLLFALVGGLQFAVKRLPLTSPILYLILGCILGAGGHGLVNPHGPEHVGWIERVSEIVVIISLFTAGLKLRADQGTAHWWPAYRLASATMAITIGLIACVAHWGLGLAWGPAVLLGAVLAPTDPVLASEVQVRHPSDRDPLRFTLTGEAGFNDGMAFPFVMLGLGLLGLHEIGPYGGRWFLVDVLWQVGGGLGIGAVLGTFFSSMIGGFRRNYPTAPLLDDFLGIGLICLSYGAALAIHTYGFLAVFSAGLCLGRVRHSQPSAQAALKFNEQLERLGEVVAVILVGALLSSSFQLNLDLWLIPALLFAIRPAAVAIGLLGSHSPKRQRNYIAWFGIRGIGSLYYLHYAISHGLPDPTAARLTAIVLTAIATSIILHGVSVTPLMNLYNSRNQR